MDVVAQFGTERVTIVRLDPSLVRFRVGYDPGSQRRLSTWATRSGALLAINGGFFTPENDAIGMVVSDGQRWGTSLGGYAGMFAVTAAGEVSVRWLTTWPYHPNEALAEALQSFPVLVKPGGQMGFPAGTDEGLPERRTVIAQDRVGRILIIVAPSGFLSLHEMAMFLAESDLALDIALNLDGGASTGIWLSADEREVKIDSFTPIPSVILVEMR
jgi:exopolysaccharide biosynthesis protein